MYHKYRDTETQRLYSLIKENLCVSVSLRLIKNLILLL